MVRRTVRSPWSWRIGTVGGIPIRVHVTLLLLLFWVGTWYWLAGGSPRSTAANVLLFVAVFAVIVIHELSHALMARRFGVHTHDILLLPIGGIASLERIPERPQQELAVALVGPLINLVIAGLLWAGLAIARAPLDPTAPSTLGQTFAARFLWINVALAVFNLLPAFPLDGGRVLRALLSLGMPRERATEIASIAGQVLAAVLVVFGILFNLWLVLIGVVVWLGAQRERQMVRIRSSFAGVTAREVMSRRIDAVEVGDPIATAASRMVDGGASILPVVDHGRVVGALTPADLAQGMRAAGPASPIAAAPLRAVVRVPPDEPLEKVLDELQAAPQAIAVVVDGDTTVGLVTPDQLATYAALHSGRERATTM